MKQESEFIIDAEKPYLSRELINFFKYRQLLYFFAWRDIKVRYRHTLLGFTWVLLQPLLMVGVVVFIFGSRFNSGESSGQYAIFILSGLIFWNSFSFSVNAASSSILSQANIIKKIYFPRFIIPFTGILVAAFDLMITAGIFVVLAFILSDSFSILHFLWSFPLAVLLFLIAVSGCTLWAAALTARYRDFKFIIPVTLQILFFISPLIYPLSYFQEKWITYLLSVNPMVAPIEVFKCCLYPGVFSYESLLISVFTSVVLIFSGVFVFRSVEQSMADIL